MIVGPRLKDLGRWSSGGTPPKDDEQAWQGDVPWLSAKDVDRDILRTPSAFITEDAAARSSRVVPAGSIVMIVRGMALAHGLPVVITNERAAFNQDLRALVPKREHDARFLHYALRGSRDRLGAHIDKAAHGTARVVDSIFLERIWAPDRRTQSAIADFLDRECARIASLLARAERLAVVVRESQQAELDSYFAPSSSGRAVTRLHRVLRTRPSYGVLVPQLVDEGVPFIRVGDLDAMRRGVELEVARIPATQSTDYRRTIVEAGDVLISVVGSIDKAAVVPPRLSGANIARAVARLQPALVAPNILLAWTKSTHYLTQAKLATSADTAQPTLNIGDLAAFEIALPATTEATQRLTRSIESHRRRQDNADDAIQRLKLGLNEHRDALIAEAVTGQLDVSAMSEAEMDERAHAAAEAVAQASPTPARVR